MPERISVLHRISTAMLGTLELHRLLPEIVRAAKQVGRADAGAVLLVDAVEDALRIVASEGLSEPYVASRRFAMDRARALFRGFDTHFEFDLTRDNPDDAAALAPQGLVRVVAFPLIHENGLIGSISIYSRDRTHRLDQVELDLMYILAAQASSAIANARLFEAERQARRQQETLLSAQQESERQKDEFLSIVSHELKTPLTPLKALAQLLRLRLRKHRQEGRVLDLDSLDTNLRTIERQVDRMAGLVNDLLEVSRAGQGRFELQLQEFDLVPVVREVVQRQDELVAEDGRHRFIVEAPDAMVITGDTMRIEQAVANLLGNAVKYSPSGGDVRISVTPRETRVAIVVSDPGIGIDKDELGRLGQPFARGSRRARTFSGMGIGLYLARLVAERHGGALTLESEGEDKGTTVTLELPREPKTL